MFYFFIFLHKVSAGARPKKEKKHSSCRCVFAFYFTGDSAGSQVSTVPFWIDNNPNVIAAESENILQGGRVTKF